jgi:fatty acid desaturase
LKNCRIIVNPNYFLRILIHPHNDHLHALHHLEPQVPSYNLRGLNETLSGFNSSYNQIKRNDSYILGPFSALKDLTCSL